MKKVKQLSEKQIIEKLEKLLTNSIKNISKQKL